jgi:hypothetical protein
MHTNNWEKQVYTHQFIHKPTLSGALLAPTHTHTRPVWIANTPWGLQCTLNRCWLMVVDSEAGAALLANLYVYRASVHTYIRIARASEWDRGLYTGAMFQADLPAPTWGPGRRRSRLAHLFFINSRFLRRATLIRRCCSSLPALRAFCHGSLVLNTPRGMGLFQVYATRLAFRSGRLHKCATCAYGVERALMLCCCVLLEFARVLMLFTLY